MSRLKIISINEDPSEKLIEIKDFAELIGVTKEKVRRKIRQGVLIGHLNGYIVVLPHSQIEVAKKVFSKKRNSLKEVLEDMGNPCSVLSALRLWGVEYEFYKSLNRWKVPSRLVDKLKSNITSYFDTGNLVSTSDITQALSNIGSPLRIGQVVRSSCNPVKKVLNKNYYSVDSIDTVRAILKKNLSNSGSKDVYYSRPLVAKDVTGEKKTFQDAKAAVKWLKSRGIKNACRHAIYQQIANPGRHTAYGLSWSYDGEKKEIDRRNN